MGQSRREFLRAGLGGFGAINLLSLIPGYNLLNGLFPDEEVTGLPVTHALGIRVVPEKVDVDIIGTVSGTDVSSESSWVVMTIPDTIA